jgi:hypothetical protein
LENLETTLGRLFVASAGFLDHELRAIQFKFTEAALPPLLSNFLMSRYN